MRTASRRAVAPTSTEVPRNAGTSHREDSAGGAERFLSIVAGQYEARNYLAVLLALSSPVVHEDTRLLRFRCPTDGQESEEHDSPFYSSCQCAVLFPMFASSVLIESLLRPLLRHDQNQERRQLSGRDDEGRVAMNREESHTSLQAEDEISGSPAMTVDELYILLQRCQCHCDRYSRPSSSSEASKSLTSIRPKQFDIRAVSSSIVDETMQRLLDVVAEYNVLHAAEEESDTKPSPPPRLPLLVTLLARMDRHFENKTEISSNPTSTVNRSESLFDDSLNNLSEHRRAMRFDYGHTDAARRTNTRGSTLPPLDAVLDSAAAAIHTLTLPADHHHHHHNYPARSTSSRTHHLPTYRSSSCAGNGADVPSQPRREGDRGASAYRAALDVLLVVVAALREKARSLYLSLLPVPTQRDISAVAKANVAGRGMSEVDIEEELFGGPDGIRDDGTTLSAAFDPFAQSPSSSSSSLHPASRQMNNDGFFLWHAHDSRGEGTQGASSEFNRRDRQLVSVLCELGVLRDQKTFPSEMRTQPQTAPMNEKEPDGIGSRTLQEPQQRRYDRVEVKAFTDAVAVLSTISPVPGSRRVQSSFDTEGDGGEEEEKQEDEMETEDTLTAAAGRLTVNVNQVERFFADRRVSSPPSSSCAETGSDQLQQQQRGLRNVPVGERVRGERSIGHQILGGEEEEDVGEEPLSISATAPATITSVGGAEESSAQSLQSSAVLATESAVAEEAIEEGEEEEEEQYESEIIIQAAPRLAGVMRRFLPSSGSPSSSHAADTNRKIAPKTTTMAEEMTEDESSRIPTVASQSNKRRKKKSAKKRMRADTFTSTTSTTTTSSSDQLLLSLVSVDDTNSRGINATKDGEEEEKRATVEAGHHHHPGTATVPAHETGKNGADESDEAINEDPSSSRVSRVVGEKNKREPARLPTYDSPSISSFTSSSSMNSTSSTLPASERNVKSAGRSGTTVVTVSNPGGVSAAANELDPFSLYEWTPRMPRPHPTATHGGADAKQRFAEHLSTRHASVRNVASGSSAQLLNNRPSLLFEGMPYRSSGSGGIALVTGAGMRRRARVPFSSDEDDAIQRGYARFGNDFRSILSAYRDVFAETRTPRDLYDHWRTALRRRAMDG